MHACLCACLCVGVSLAELGDSLGQQYHSPCDVISRTDVMIVGRGIVGADDPATAARQYRDAGYQAYTELRHTQ